ncbi:caspase family protein [Candidatus Puniceispirillum sp.]|nr:caspase family protein [Candidatus Puniceispirillum sp.]
MMTRFVLTLLVGLVVSFSGTASGDIPASTLNEIKSSCSSYSVLGPAKVLECENKRKQEYLAVISQQKPVAPEGKTKVTSATQAAAEKAEIEIALRHFNKSNKEGIEALKLLAENSKTLNGRLAAMEALALSWKTIGADKALLWLERMVPLGSGDAANQLAAIYCEGLIVTQDIKRCLYYHQEGVKLGVEDAHIAYDEIAAILERAPTMKAIKQSSAELIKAEKDKQQQTISSDTKLPTITIASVNTQGKQGIVRGRVNDNTGIAELTVDGTVVPVTSSGDFEYSTFVPSGGLSLKVQATDLAGLTSMMSVTLERNAGTATAAINFDRLNPMGKRVKINKDALALIIGVADYENTPAKAIFADSDAMMFRDYASEKLGIPESRIKTLVNDGADERELLLSVKSWLARASKQGKSDVYIFFAGHGLASDNGEKMYLLPYDGAPELLDDTAILRDRLFSDIASANPRSVTVFLDTCYSGTTRGTDMLIASRPIAIKALKQSIPDNFTVMTAAAGDQTAKPLEEAKHGMFSYFLMKGMEGEADSNQDNQITAGELHQYVQQNVIQQSSGSQTPELQGDAERVLVRFQ